MLTMTRMTRHFGISTDDLTNWQKRGFVNLPGRRGVERTFGPDQRDEVLKAVFAKALNSGGLKMEAAAILATQWVALAKEKSLPRFYVFSPITEASVLLSDESAINAGLMATILADDDDVHAGYAGDGKPRGRSWSATQMTVVDLGSIVDLVDEALRAEVKEERASLGIDEE